MTVTEDESIRRIGLARQINRRAAEQYASRGLPFEEISIASMYSAFDLAECMHDGNGIAAIEWMRTALDVIERQLLRDDPRR